MKLLRELAELRAVAREVVAAGDRLRARRAARPTSTAGDDDLEEARRRARAEFATVDPEAFADLACGPRRQAGP